MIFPMKQIAPDEASIMMAHLPTFVREMVGFPSYWWEDEDGVKMWPLPARHVHLTFDGHAKPKGFILGYEEVQ